MSFLSVPINCLDVKQSPVRQQPDGLELTEAVTPLVMAMFRLCLPEVWYLLWIFRPTQTGIPMIMAGMEMPAIRAIPTGAPTRVPSCHISFFFRLQGFLPQNVHPNCANMFK